MAATTASDTLPPARPWRLVGYCLLALALVVFFGGTACWQALQQVPV